MRTGIIISIFILLMVLPNISNGLTPITAFNVTHINTNDSNISTYPPITMSDVWYYSDFDTNGGLYFRSAFYVIRVNGYSGDVGDSIVQAYNYITSQYETIGTSNCVDCGIWLNISLSNNYISSNIVKLRAIESRQDNYDYYSDRIIAEIQGYNSYLPTIPNISSPVNNSRQWNNSINYTWNQSTDADNDTITYHQQISIYSNFSPIFNQSNVSNNWTGSITGLADGVIYFGRVRSHDGYEYSNWSATVQFTENTKTVYSNITLSPSNATSLQNLTVTFNATDAESDTMTNYTRWYKDNVLQTALNDSITVVAAGNTSNGEKWRVDVFGYDGYENSTAIPSNEVIIGSANSAPTFTSLVLTPSTGQLGSVINVNASGISDDSTSWQAQTYYLATDNSKVYLGNSSWSNTSYISYNVVSPWSDANTRTVYTVIYDSGNVSGVENLTSSPQTAFYTSQVTVTGGGSGGGGYYPTPTPTITAKLPPTINLPALSKSPFGTTVLMVLAVITLFMVIYGLFYKHAKLGTLVTGLIGFMLSISALGWLKW